MKPMLFKLVLILIMQNLFSVQAADISPAVQAINPRVVEWRRDIHAHPELGNREFRTSKLVAQHLEGLGLEVETGIAYTGVVALLKGGQPGPTIALRADMDALPVTEEVDPAVRLESDNRIPRPDCRRDACLRSRQSCRHSDGRGRAADRDER